MPKISVIIPCLNMASYINECLNSVRRQSMPDIEILVIDAGSTDGTLDLLQTHMNQDSRVKIICSVQKSYGYQVNLGIAAAAGDYLTIVDADDRIVLDMYETLYSIAVKTDADYVKGTGERFFTITDKDIYRMPFSQFSREKYGKIGMVEVCPKEIPELLIRDNFMWCGIYRSDFFKKVKLHESPGAAFQDLGGLLQTQIYAEKAVYIAKCVYEYRQDNMKASAYNKKAFYFIENEYKWAEQFLPGLPKAWQEIFFYKEFLHFMDRVRAMATSDLIWDGAVSHMTIIARRLKKAYEEGILNKRTFTEEEWQDIQLLWENPNLIYEKYKKIYNPRKLALKNVFDFIEGNQGIIFGSGKFGKFLHEQFLHRGCKNIAAYCDNNPELQGRKQYGVGILAPEEAVRNFPQFKYIVANKDHASDMVIQLENLGVGKENIVLYSAGIDTRLFGESLK